MFLNDELGDCTVAAAAHMIQQWTFFAEKPFIPTDQDVLKAYKAVSGYVPGLPETDNGTCLLDVLNYWRKTGIGNHKIFAYAQVDYTNAEERRLAIELFGNLYVGVQLPVAVQGANDWTVGDGGIYTENGRGRPRRDQIVTPRTASTRWSLSTRARALASPLQNPIRSPDCGAFGLPALQHGVRDGAPLTLLPLGLRAMRFLSCTTRLPRHQKFTATGSGGAFGLFNGGVSIVFPVRNFDHFRIPFDPPMGSTSILTIPE